MPSLVSRSSPSVIRLPISSPTRALPYVPLVHPNHPHPRSPPGICPHDGLLRLFWQPHDQHPPRDRHLGHHRDQRIRWDALRPPLYADVDHECGGVVDVAVDDAGGGTDEGLHALETVGDVFDLGVRGDDECESGGGDQFCVSLGLHCIVAGCASCCRRRVFV